MNSGCEVLLVSVHQEPLFVVNGGDSQHFYHKHLVMEEFDCWSADQQPHPKIELKVTSEDH